MMQRRVLTVLGVVAIVALAACTSGDKDENTASLASPQIIAPVAEQDGAKDIFDPFDRTHSFYMSPSLNGSNFVYLSGDITGKTAVEARKVLSALPNSETTYAALSSNGGDIQAAMDIGRLLRAKRVKVLVISNQCASACVLVYAGGVTRIATSPVIIHRPYFSDNGRAATYAETQKEYVKLGDMVRSYLQEMNVSPGLWDAMVSIDPSESHSLSSDEQNRFGLLGRDPVEDEMRRQSFAKKLGIATDEFVRREALTKQQCPQGANSLEEMTAWSTCYNTIMHNGEGH